VPVGGDKVDKPRTDDKEPRQTSSPKDNGGVGKDHSQNCIFLFQISIFYLFTTFLPCLFFKSAPKYVIKKHLSLNLHLFTIFFL